MIRVEAAITPDSLRTFIDLPMQIYRNFTQFEPPLAVDRRMLLDPARSALWKRAKVQYWLAFRGDTPVGRISAQVDPVLPVGIEHGAGTFGCLDAIDDAEVVAALFAAAERWLRDQHCTSLFGPCALTMNDEPGLLVYGDDQPAMTMCPWHPPYLLRHVEALGFAKLRDLHNWRLDLARVNALETKASRRLAQRIPKLRIRHPNRSSYASDIRILCDVYNDGWRDHWGFVPLSPTDLDGLTQLMKWLVPRRAFKIVELGGEPVAALLLIPNLFELTRALGSRPSPLGWIRLGWRALTHRFRSGRIIIFGLSKRLQGSVSGSAIAALLVDDLIIDQTALRGNWVEAGWVLENNLALNTMLKSFNFQIVKTLRIFGRSISPV